jgi:hypothetical protein
MRKTLGISIFLVMAMALVFAGTSAAATVTVGQLDPSPEPECEYPDAYDEFQTSVASGATYAVPAPGGVLTSWSTNALAGAEQELEMKVFRPVSPGVYLVVAHDGPRPLTPSQLNTFAVSIPVQAGDLVGMHILDETESSVTACSFVTGSPLDLEGWAEGDVTDGSTLTQEEEGPGRRLNISASVDLAPVPAPAAVLAPAPLPVVVRSCRVPNLAGKKLKASKKALRNRDCRIGKVKKRGDATAKTGEVVKQSAKPGTILAPGAKVTVKLG